ncbi:unnamed protein product [Brassica rapa]|uniref:Uncharacterized protein n=1 Tax=Brassica campestris TaxID=3711 RepID=A0A8D9HUG7_BRACM|nr:unnamed protein product [Brassica rapa]
MVANHGDDYTHLMICERITFARYRHTVVVLEGRSIAVASSRSVNMYVGLLTLVSSGKYPMMLTYSCKLETRY